MSFKELATQLGGHKGTVIGLDPGETTGFSVFYDYNLKTAGQFPSSSISLAWNNYSRLLANVARTSSDWSWDHDPLVPVNDRTLRRACHEDNPWFPHQREGCASEMPHVVIEDYRIYSFKADDHKFSNVFTVKVLTTYELISMLVGLSVKLTLAHAVKAFCTDDKLRSWGYWPKGQRHARDAIRHGAYYILEKALTSPTTNPQARKVPTFEK